MDEYSGKRTAGGVVAPRKGSSPVLRGTADNREPNTQFCNRIGCSGRLNYMKRSQIGSSEKVKYPKSPFRSSSGKKIVASPSRTSSMVISARKCFQESRKKLDSQSETYSSESGSAQDEVDVPVIPTSANMTQTKFEAEDKVDESGEDGSSSASNRSRRIFRQNYGLGNQDAQPGSSVTSASKNSGQWLRNSSRYGLRNLRCNSISDVVSQDCSSSSSESNGIRKRDMVKKRNSEGESSSSSKGKKIVGPSFEDSRVSQSRNGISISDSRPARNFPGRDIGISSVRTRRIVKTNDRIGLPNQASGRDTLPTESPDMTSQVLQPETPFSMNITSSSHQFSTEASTCLRSYSRMGNDEDNLPSVVPNSSGDLSISHLMNRDRLRRYNMDGIAEVLLALERIEQDEELTYEQLLALETNLFLGGLGFYDQHRDMRLDIDNMSYEELLELEEKMGNVSTALPEEMLFNCLRRCIYQPTTHKEQLNKCSGDGDDTQCSICQEEYVVGDEVGKLGCLHGFHVECIYQWLRLKNWCPVCKAAAALSQSSLPF